MGVTALHPRTYGHYVSHFSITESLIQVPNIAVILKYPGGRTMSLREATATKQSYVDREIALLSLATPQAGNDTGLLIPLLFHSL